MTNFFLIYGRDTARFQKLLFNHFQIEFDREWIFKKITALSCCWNRVGYNTLLCGKYSQVCLPVDYSVHRDLAHSARPSFYEISVGKVVVPFLIEPFVPGSVDSSSPTAATSWMSIFEEEPRFRPIICHASMCSRGFCRSGFFFLKKFSTRSRHDNQLASMQRRMVYCSRSSRNTIAVCVPVKNTPEKESKQTASVSSKVLGMSLEIIQILPSIKTFQMGLLLSILMNVRFDWYCV